MKSPLRHHRRHHRSRTRNPPQSFDVIAKSRPAPDSDGSFYVELWLNQVRDCQKKATTSTPRSDDGGNDDDYQHHKSSWQPHNLPVARIALGNHAKLQQQETHHFHDDLTIVTSPTGSRTGASSNTRSHRAAKFTYHTENKTRKRMPSEDSQNSLAYKSGFEKRPRRKIRASRYETKKDVFKDDVKGRATTQRSRALRRQLRSSRDVLDNFTSAAISDKRLIMKTDLTAGLFLNGRSSTHPSKMSDLDFNDMSFLESREIAARKSKCDVDVEEQHSVGPSTSPRQDNDHVLASNDNSARHPRVARPSSAFKTSSSCNHNPEITICLPKGSTHAANHTGAERAAQRDQLEHDNGGNLVNKVDENLVIFSASVDDRANSQRSPSSGATVSRSATASRTPEHIHRALIQTGVYDGTKSIVEPSRITQRTPQSQDRQCFDDFQEDLGNKDSRPGMPIYEEKGTMMTPGLQSSTRYRQQPPSEDPIQCHRQEVITDADMEHLNQPNGLYSDMRLDATHSQDPSSFLKVMETPGEVSGHTNPIGFNMADPGCWFHSAPNASFGTSQVLNGFSRSLGQNNVGIENTNSSFWQGHTPSQPAPYGTAVSFSNHGFYKPSVTLDFSSSDGLSRRDSSRDDGHKTGPAPMGYHSLPTFQPWQVRNFQQVDEEAPPIRLQPSALSGPGESMMEFIERIEAEALLNWEEVQRLHSMNDHENNQSLGGDAAGYNADYSREEMEMPLLWRPDWRM